MIRIKDGVDIAGLAPEMVVALLVAQQVYEQHGFKDVTVTSARDSVHSAGSKHYVGMALDLRTSAAGVSFDKSQAITSDIKAALGAQYDVINEGDHLHIELDPKAGKL